MKSSIRNINQSTGSRLTPAYLRRHRSWLQALRGRLALALFIALTLVSSNFLLLVEAADGDPDPGFGAGGKVITDFFGYGDIGNNVAIQPDGKIIVPGRVELNASELADFGLARYNSDGTLDASFGIGGKVNTDFFGFSDGCFAAAVQNDGKIVAAGGAFGAIDNDCALARYNSDGSLDVTFGIGGKVTSDFASDINDEALDLVVQNDGKIVVVVGKATSSDCDFIVARYNSDGTPDATFGIGGSTTTDFFGEEDSSYAVALQSDGKIIAAGPVTNSVGDNDFGVARYNNDGTPDATFGVGGKVTTDFFGMSDGAFGIAQQADGKIIAVGSANVIGFDLDFALARYNANGTPDALFGIGGKVTTDFFGEVDSASDVVLACDGTIVVAGIAGIVNGPSDVGVARYHSEGSLDPAFGIGGKVNTDFLGGQDSGYALDLQSDGKIVVAGAARPDVSLDSLEFVLARYDSNGCVTAPCPKSQGHWKNNPSTWPVNTLTLGSESYTKSELLAFLTTSTQSDASLILARQLIAAKLNIANGSDPAPVNNVITTADSLLSGFAGKLPYKVKSSSAVGQAMTAIAGVLNSYNNALSTPGCAP